ncbi:MAG: PaaI family thioesterase [Lentisphaerae bacterium]|nr:PaaI family thioesterase [Lentisphaerota bacterium]
MNAMPDGPDAPACGSAPKPGPPDPEPGTSGPVRPLPRTRTCYVCGVENPGGFRLAMRVEADGTVAGDYTPPPEDNGYRGIVHGGIAMTLMDEVMTWAAILGTKRLCVAAEMTTRFRRPMPVGVAYRFSGRVTRATARLVLAEASVTGPDGAPVATAEGKYMPMPEGSASAASVDFVDEPPAALV